MNTNAGGDRRFARLAVFASALVALLLVVGVLAWVAVRPALLAAQARTAAFDGDYTIASNRLQALSEMDQKCYYDTLLTVAGIADYRSEWEQAEALLEAQLSAGDDSETYTTFAEQAKELLIRCTYHRAMALYEQEEYTKASRLAASINGYEPAEKLYRLSYQAYLASQPTPEPTPVPTLAPSPEPTLAPTSTPIPEPATAFPQSATPAVTAAVTPAPTPVPTATPTPAPTALPDGHVAVGYHHVVFLREDGTVLAYGDNTYGQTDVSSWHDVVAVAAGAYHTIGLTADGRLLTAGDNSYGQTDAALFSDVRQIAANAWNTCVLLGDGQVMTTGYNNYDFVMELTEVEKIVAGSYGLLIRSGGVNHASNPGLQLPEECITGSVSRGYAMGIDRGGTVYSTGITLPAWQNVIRISAGENAALALTQDGKVLSHAFDNHVKCTFDFGQPVLAICAGPNQYAFVLQDGSLEIRYADGAVVKPEEKLW